MAQQAAGAWKACLDYIKSQLPAGEYDTWFGALEFVALKGYALTISVPTKFVSEYIAGHHLDLVRTALNNHFGPSFNLVWQNAEHMAEVRKRQEESERLQTQNSVGAAQVQRPPLDPQLNPHYTFKNFVEGKSNKLARSVALAIAENPGQSTFNPFFLYGPSGVGKTHLVNAIGVRLKEMQPDKRVLFVSAHVFKQQYTESVLQNKQNDFMNFYQSVEVLIIDDIQEATTPRTQQTFFHIFNHLQQNGRQIIITCDRPPAMFEGIEERMLTRFKWGMIAELEKPDTALRRDILTAKVKRDGLSFPKDVIQYISQNVESSVRELEGIINSIMLYSLVDNCDINLQLAAKVVSRAINLEKKDLTIESITNTVAKHYGVKAKELYAKSRKQVIVNARQVAMYLSHKYTETSYKQIGRTFGGRDHSTVIHSCNLVAARIKADKDFRHEVESIESTLKK
jgi:chromosomal replication initiator protein